MANKEHNNLIEQFSEFKELKNIDRKTLISVMEESFRNVIAKTFGSDENFNVILNPEKGDFETSLAVTAPGYWRLEVWRTFFSFLPPMPALVTNPIWFDKTK